MPGLTQGGIDKPESETDGQPLPESVLSATRPRKVWVAVVLNLLVYGLGYLYAGQVRRAAFFWGVSWALSLSMLAGLVTGWLLPSWPRPWSLLPFVIVLACLTVYEVCLVIDTVRTTRALTAFRSRWFNRWYVYVAIIVLSSTVGDIPRGWVRSNYIEAFWSPSGSMHPTVFLGDHFFVDKKAYGAGETPQRGDIVMFVSPVDPDVQLVKRAVAVADDTVEIREKKLYINGALVDEPYAYLSDLAHSTSPRYNFGPVTVPKGRFFVLGDNRDQRYDSRYWGFVGVENLRGRPTLIYWSRHRGITRWNRIGQQIR